MDPLSYLVGVITGALALTVALRLVLGKDFGA